MNLNLEHFQPRHHKEVLLLQKIYNCIYKDSLKKIGAPEGPYILTEINEAVMSFRINKPSRDKEFNLEQIKEILTDAQSYLNSIKNETKSVNLKNQIDQIVISILAQ